MSVPNTTTFSLQSITAELYSDAIAGRSLSDCFTDSIDASFDSNYGSKSAPNDMLEFRNYDKHRGVLWMYLDILSVGTNTSRLNYEFTLHNASSNSKNFSVRVFNDTKGGSAVILRSGTIAANTTNVSYSGISGLFSSANEEGDEFIIQLSDDGGTTWNAVVQLIYDPILNYDGTLI